MLVHNSSDYKLWYQVSEGLDFADKAGRAVVVTGIPYAMKTDPKVQSYTSFLLLVLIGDCLKA